MESHNEIKEPVLVKIVEQEKKSGIEKYLKYTPLAYFFLILYSYVGLNAYYSVFGIDILAHMSVQELVLSPLKSVKSVITASLIVLVLFSFSSLNSYFFKKHKTEGFEPLVMGLRGYLFHLMIAYPGLHLYVALNANGRPWIYEIVLYAFIGHVLFIVPGVYLMFRWRYEEDPKKIIPSDTWFRQHAALINTITILVFGSILHYWSMTLDAYDLVEQKTSKVKTVTFLHKTATISGVLIGESNSSIFLRDTLIQSNKAYLKKDIQEIEYKETKVLHVNRLDSIATNPNQ
ncbi:MAG: hypothetical protein HEP71_02005 [Roseivirga sp.]|nr:hypothetical protein [Roseivirga sp.]